MFNSKSKKGQVQQAFVFIISAIVIIIILLFGYKAIKGTAQAEESIGLLEFETELRNDIELISSEYGTLQTKRYNLPPGYNEICFVDLVNRDMGEIDKPIIKKSVQADLQENIFLFGQDKVPLILYVEDFGLAYAPYYECIESNANIEFKVEGKGNKALVRISNKQVCQTANNSSSCFLLDSVSDSYKSECCQRYGLCC